MICEPTVGVVIVNWRNAKDTVACLDSLISCNWKNIKIVICDNGSGDGSIDFISRWLDSKIGDSWCYLKAFDVDFKAPADNYAHKVFLVDVEKNLGFAGGNNIGVRCLKRFCDELNYFWFLNNDTVIASDAIEHMVERMKLDPQIGTCGARLVYVEPFNRLQTHGGAVHNKWLCVSKYIGHLEPADSTVNYTNVENQMDYVCGASMFVSDEFIESVGLMREDYFLYFEELDWAVRGKKKGFRLGYADKAVVWHKEGASLGTHRDTRKTSFLSDYYLFRNRLVFTARFYPFALATVWLGLLMVGFKRLFRGQYDRFLLCLKLLCGWKMKL